MNIRTFSKQIQLIIISLILHACNSDDEPSLYTVNGSVELVNEFGEDVNSYADVKVTFILGEEEVITSTDAEGNYALKISSWEDVTDVYFEKSGFASQHLFTEPEVVESLTIQLIQRSTLEVTELTMTEQDCGSVRCFGIQFTADHFYSDATDKRYFDLHVYDDGQLIGTQRFFSFQETTGQLNVEMISATSASVSFDFLSLYFLNEYSPNAQLEFRLYGATTNETYKYYEQGLTDNSLNATYASTLVTLN